MFTGLLIKYGRIIKYIISGGTAAVVNIVTFAILTYTTSLAYLINSIIAFLVSFGVSFGLQKFWTFKNTDTEIMHKQAVLYFATSIANLGITLVLMYIFVDLIYPITFKMLLDINHWEVISQIMAGALVAFGSFFVYRKIFKM